MAAGLVGCAGCGALFVPHPGGPVLPVDPETGRPVDVCDCPDRRRCRAWAVPVPVCVGCVEARAGVDDDG